MAIAHPIMIVQQMEKDGVALKANVPVARSTVLACSRKRVFIAPTIEMLLIRTWPRHGAQDADKIVKMNGVAQDDHGGQKRYYAMLGTFCTLFFSVCKSYLNA